MDLNLFLNEKRSLIDICLLQAMDDSAIPETLVQAMRYSLEAGGKRLRPILAIAGAQAVGGSAQKVMNVAIALEMIHTFSLIHDDLPAMDNDSLRRGKPTNHKVFGEANAILAGDGLLTEAFSVLAKTPGVEPHLLMEVIRDVADATGGRGMTGGQVIDMESTGKKISEEELANLHCYKTGALIKVSVTSGAKLLGASPEDIDALERYGKAAGLSFQIADDILDIEGSESSLGKDVGSDKSKDKSTYPCIIGIEASRKKAARLVDDAISALACFDDKAEPLRLIAKYIVERDR